MSDMDIDAGSSHEPEKEPSPQFIPPPTTSGCQQRFPQRYHDFLPNSTTQLPHLPERIIVRAPSPLLAEPRAPSPVQSEVLEPELRTITTKPDEFGLFRVYETYPSLVPDENQGLDDCCDAPGLASAPSTSARRWWTGFGQKIPDLSPHTLHQNIFAPFLNAMVFWLMNWFYSGSNMKSVAELQSLVNDVLLADDYDPEHLKNFSARSEIRRLDTEPGKGSSSIPFTHENGWKQSTVRIKLPAENVKQTEDSAPELEVPDVYHRSRLEVFITAIQEESAKSFHYTPFSLFWKPTPESTPERVYSELYNSDAFLEEHRKVQQLPPEPGPQYERAIAAGMLWSDSTHLANFGTQSLWPGYTFFGNQSKYGRGKPSQFAAHHFAYIPSVSLFFDSRKIDLNMTIAIPASRDAPRRIHGNFWTCCICADDDSPQT